MKLSYRWLKEYVDFDLEPIALGDLLTNLGLEVEGMEKYESIQGGLRGVVVGQVVACAKHPNADKLSLTKVNVGGDTLLNIVCGAPNVASGQTVLVATVGTTLYADDGQVWTIRKAKIRGEVSMGMICAEDELGLGSSHDGIMVLDDGYAAGTSASEIFPVFEDFIYEIGLTPNRSDATNHMGAARDLVAALRVRMGQDIAISLPDVQNIEVGEIHPDIQVEVVDPGACPRYSGLMIRDVKIGESPEWLRARLKSIGVRSINNVVDITNFILHETGQPLHAFDYDKIEGQKVIVDCLPEGTKFVTLDEVERKLRAEDLMICNSRREPMCIAGVFGGTNSEVSDDTTSIFLESAHFNASSIRMTSMGHLLRTEAAKCFEKGSDPNITVFALQRAAFLLHKYAGARIEGPILDVYPNPVEKAEIRISYEYINRLCGNILPSSTWQTIATSLDMTILDYDKEGMRVAVPTDKADVTRPADLVEEFLRVYGYDHIEVEDQLRTTLVYSKYPDPELLKDKVCDTLAANGFHQMMNLSLTQSKYYQTLHREEAVVEIMNTSNIHLDIMRPDMLVNGMETVAYNLNRQQSDLRLFEFGKTYRKSGSGYKEREHLSLFICGRVWRESSQAGSGNVDLYHLKGLVRLILTQFGILHPDIKILEDEGFSYALGLEVSGKKVGRIGKVGKELCGLFGVESEVFAADLDWSVLKSFASEHQTLFTPISRFPSMRRDLALILPEEVRYEDIHREILRTAGPTLKDVNLFDVYRNEKQLGKGNKSYAISLVFEDYDKTMTDKEVDKLRQKVIKSLTASLGASLR